MSLRTVKAPTLHDARMKEVSDAMVALT